MIRRFLGRVVDAKLEPRNARAHSSSRSPAHWTCAEVAEVLAALIRAWASSVEPLRHQRQFESPRRETVREPFVSRCALVSPKPLCRRHRWMQQRPEAQVEQAVAMAEHPIDPFAAQLTVAEVAAAADATQAALAPCQPSPGAAAQTAKARPVAKELAAGLRQSDAEMMMRRSVPSHWNDGGDGVCLTWSSPLTCRIARTLPTRARPEKPCGVDWSKN